MGGGDRAIHAFGAVCLASIHAIRDSQLPPQVLREESNCFAVYFKKARIMPCVC